MPASNRSSSLPAWPTNGLPCWSSWKPGASPTNIRSASESPTPKTTWVRPSARRHFVQPATSAAKVASSAATTAPAATTASRTRAEARLLGGAVSGEHGELLAHVRGAAVRAVGVVTVPDELLEVRLALHAHVLVDRHRRGSVGLAPDGPQTESRTLLATPAHAQPAEDAGEHLGPDRHPAVRRLRPQDAQRTNEPRRQYRAGIRPVEVKAPAHLNPRDEAVPLQRERRPGDADRAAVEPRDRMRPAETGERECPGRRGLSHRFRDRRERAAARARSK